MTDIVLVAIIGGTFGVAGIAMQAYSTVISKRIEKNQKEGEAKINGRMDQLIETEKTLSLEQGKAIGRAELLREIEAETPFVYFLDDSEDDIKMIVLNIKLFGPIKYVTYTDEDQFINNLTRIKALYVIDNILTRRNGLHILAEVMEKNPKNVVILATGSLDDKEVVEEYHSAGIFKIIYKDEKDFFISLSNTVKEGLRELLSSN